MLMNLLQKIESKINHWFQAQETIRFLEMQVRTLKARSDMWQSEANKLYKVLQEERKAK